MDSYWEGYDQMENKPTPEDEGQDGAVTPEEDSTNDDIDREEILRLMLDILGE